MKVIIQLALSQIKKFKLEAFLFTFSIALTLTMITIVTILSSIIYTANLENSKYQDPYNVEILGITNIDKFLDELGIENIEYYEIIDAQYYLTSEDGDLFIIHTSNGGNKSVIPNIHLKKFELEEGVSSTSYKEIIVPKASSYKVGDTLKLNSTKNGIDQGIIEARVVGRNKSNNVFEYYFNEDISESINFDSAGYGIKLVFKDGTKNIDDIVMSLENTDVYTDQMQVFYNRDYNYFKGMQNEPGTSMYIYLMLTVILITIICLITFTLILNAFDNLMIQKEHIFSVLRSIGTTKSQLGIMVFTEGIILSTIGIVLGLISGIFLSDFLIDGLNIIISNIETINLDAEGSLIIVRELPKLLIPLIVILALIVIFFVITKHLRRIYKYSPVQNQTTISVKRKVKIELHKSNLFKGIARINTQCSRDFNGIKIALFLTTVLLIVINTYLSSIMSMGNETLLDYKYDTIITSETYDEDEHENDLYKIEKLLQSYDEIEEYRIDYFSGSFDFDSTKHRILSNGNENMPTTDGSIFVVSDSDFDSFLSLTNSSKDINTIFVNISYELSGDDVTEVEAITLADNSSLYVETNNNINDQKILEIRIDKVLTQIPIEFNKYKDFNYGSIVLMNYSNYKKEYYSKLKIDNFKIEVQSHLTLSNVKKLKNDINNLNLKESVRLNSETQNIYIRDYVQETILTVSLTIYSFFILIVLVNILSITLISYRKKKKDIAIMKSLGATNFQIQKIQFFESIRNIMLPWIFGIVIGNLVSYFIYSISNPLFEQEINFKIQWVAITISSILVIIIIFLQQAVSVFESKQISIIEDIKSY